MSSFIISSAVATIVYMLLRRAGTCTHFLHASRSLPRVPTLLVGYDNGLSYALNPCAFLSRCQQKYGPAYRVSLGSWKLVVVSSAEGISSVFSTPSHLLCNNVMHKEMFYVVAGIKDNYVHLQEVMIRELYPLVDKSLSPRTLGQTTGTFGLALLAHINNFVQDHSGLVSLTQLTGEPLYNATNFVLLGGTFPTDTYRDFQTLNKSVPYRFARILIWFWPSYIARMRLLRRLREYLEQGQVVNCDDQFAHAFMKVFKDNNIQSFEGAQLVLNFLWGVHSNTMSNSFFLLSFLLANPGAFARVRAEVDSAVTRFGGLESLLGAGPDELDDPSLALLTSAIMETMRLTGLHAGVRQASCDFDLVVEDRTMAIRRGEYVFGNVRAAHMDATVYSDPENFMVDRFAQQPYRRKHLQTDGHPFHSLGGGRHVCKGRWLAVYVIKVLMTILLHKFEFSATREKSGGSFVPRVHPRSIGVVHTEDEIYVRLSPRKVEAVVEAAKEGL